MEFSKLEGGTGATSEAAELDAHQFVEPFETRSAVGAGEVHHLEDSQHPTVEGAREDIAEIFQAEPETTDPQANAAERTVDVKRTKPTVETGEKPRKVKVRHANLTDMSRLADIDISLFEKAYGDELPDKDEVQAMLTERFKNNPGGMFVSEVDGVVAGFVSAFRTNTPIEDFISWENSTSNGTLDGKVDPNGEYVYVTNMTIKHKAVVLGAEEMLLANLFANAIRDGVKYGYFASRMPYFGRWLEANNMVTKDPEELEILANKYFNLRDEEGKRIDGQLSMYEEHGYQLKKVYPNAFKDAASLDFGVLCKANVPPSEKLKRIKPLRIALAGALRIIARNPNVLNKVLKKIG